MEDKIQKVKGKKKCPACGFSENRFFCTRDGYEMNKCDFCQSLFLSDLPEDLSKIYSRDYFWGASDGFGYVDYDSDKEPMRSVFEKILGRLEQGNLGRRLLDVGAATGYFVALALRNGWQASGVEIGDSAAMAGRKKGLKIRTGVITDISEKNVYDVVTMFDVIEHVSSPQTDLKKAWDMLVPGGFIVIITPDAGSFYARLMNKKWHLIVPPEHVVLFNRKSLRLLLEKTGFEILENKSPGKSFTVEYVLHTLLRWQKIKLWKKLLDFVRIHPKIGNFRLPINLGDNMLIFARKTINSDG